ncbi:MAG: pyruvate kinase [Thermoguttaceae bacterium]
MTDTTSRPARPSQTKIVATLGPASSQQSQITELLEAGVDVFRINMAHGSREEHEACLAAIRAASIEVNQQVAVLVDLAGPKIRLGELPGGQLHCDADARLRFVRGDVASDDPIELTTTYEPLIDELTVGDRVMLADGTVVLAVEQVDADSARCRVTQPGLIRSRQGVNLPGVKLSTPALGPVDRDNAAWAAQAGIDFVGLSFVRTADEIRQLKSLLQSHDSEAQVIAKIEKPEALENLTEILDATDGVMVARGDLGVEIDIARVAVVQKEIVAACNRHRKPVIIATQMLDSMQHARVPTRAEVTDVANAILDGTDACMLSGETAIGKHPRLAVEMMHRIALATEPLCREQPDRPIADLDAEGVNQITEATVYAAGCMAEVLHADLLVVASNSGATALSLSKNRHYVSTIGVSDSPATLRRMCLYWGIIPLADAPADDSEALLQFVDDFGRKAGLLQPGDRIVSIAGTGLSVTAHNAIVVHELK